MGDVLSATALLTEDAKLEIKKKLYSRDYYVGVTGDLFFSAETDIISLALSCMTG